MRRFSRARPFALTDLRDLVAIARRRIPWSVVPALLVMVVLFAMPVLALFSTSLSVFDRATGETSDLSLGNFQRFFSDRANLEALLRTIRIALLTTGITLVAGYPVAYYIAGKSGRVQSYLILLMAMPLLVMTIVRTLGWLVIFGSSGPVNSLLMATGLVETPVQFLFTELVVLVGMVHILLPFMVLAVFAVLGSIDPSVLRAANSLGASPSKTFVRVTLPLSVPGIIAGSLLVFTLAASAFLTPTVLGGSRAPVLSYSIYREVYSLSNWPFASTIAVCLLGLVALVVWAYLRLIENRRYRAIFGG